MEVPEHFTELSIRMSEVLDDIGAGKETVFARRRTFLWREQIETISFHLDGLDIECFHFGSQSEGTTTPGLQSDFDILLSEEVNVMTALEDWNAGMTNLLMLRYENSPPHRYLLVFSIYRPEPGTVRLSNKNAVMFGAESWKQYMAYTYNRDVGGAIINGPSVSFIPNWDIVRACPVRKRLPEIQHWIDRCRGKHWPPVELLEAARVAPCFLVPAGHPDSIFPREEWLLSPNLIERMLMFSLNMTQIKCYIILKLIKKSLFAKIVGDSITSFHCKTIMFYTIECTPLCLWCEHNLMFLVWLCLHVLRRWLRLGRLPHYILNGVNLFDEKLSKLLQRRLLVYIDSMISNNLGDVPHIGIDNIGSRLQSCSIRRNSQAGELRRVCLHNIISLILKFDCVKSLYKLLQKVLFVTPSPNAMVAQITNELFRLGYPMQPLNSFLKLASILYCMGHIQAAERLLSDVEMRYHSKIKAVCACRHIRGDRYLDMFANVLPGNIDTVFSETQFAFCVLFLRQNSHCAPDILLFEMNRNITEEEVSQGNYYQKQWMGSAKVDARPFLNYLQYLTYGGLGERDKQLHSLRVLESYMYDERNHTNLYHQDTALNLLGHCYEMEGDYERALHYYEMSLRRRDTNNAAKLHVERVLRLISG